MQSVKNCFNFEQGANQHKQLIYNKKYHFSVIFIADDKKPCCVFNLTAWRACPAAF